MKIIFSIFFSLLTLFSYSQNAADTTIQGILISFKYSSSIFPTGWQASPIHAKGEAIPSAEIDRSKLVMAKALKKYPATALLNDLKAVYFLKSMKSPFQPIHETKRASFHCIELARKPHKPTVLTRQNCNADVKNHRSKYWATPQYE